MSEIETVRRIIEQEIEDNLPGYVVYERRRQFATRVTNDILFRIHNAGLKFVWQSPPLPPESEC